MGRLAIFALILLIFALRFAVGPDDEYGPLPDPCYPYACHLLD